MSVIRNLLKRKITFVPTNLVLDESISDRAKVLYIYLSTKADSSSFLYTEIMQDLGYSTRPTLWKTFKELLENGWVSRRKIQDIKGLFKNGYEFLLHDNKVTNINIDYGYKEFLQTIDELNDYRYVAIEIPEDLNIDFKGSSEPLVESSGWFLIKNTLSENNYDLERLFQNAQLLNKNYFLKRKRVGTKYVDFMYLGKDINKVNLTESDFRKLLGKYGDEKLKKMIITLEEWLNRKDNERFAKAVANKSCRNYFKVREWLEEKVRQQIIKERKGR